MAQIELLTLANHAEVQNGLLYLSGAGWDTVTRAYKEGNKPRPQHFSIALSVLVPWMETNQRHEMLIRVEDEDGHHKLMEAKANIRSAALPARSPAPTAARRWWSPASSSSPSRAATGCGPPSAKSSATTPSE